MISVIVEYSNRKIHTFQPQNRQDRDLQSNDVAEMKALFSILYLHAAQTDNNTN